MDLMTLVARLSLDSSEYESGLNKAQSLAGSVGSGLKTAFGTAAKIGAVAIGAATTAVGAFAKSSIDAGASFDSSMAQVAATMGKTVDEISDLREFAKEMGATTAFSASQAADALNYMALAGYDADTSMQMLPNVLNLAAAGNIDLAQASDMVTDAQSALGLTLDETTTMVDQMAKTSSKTNTSVAQLGEAMLTIGATARGISGGTTELSTVLGVLADNGIKGAEGGTHLRNAILSLQTPTKDGTEALAKLGMTYEDMYTEAGELRSLPEIFLQMQNSMEGMTQQSKDAIISGIFNKTDLAAINALIGTNKDRWDELTESIGNSTGAAEKMAETQLDNLAGDITKFKSALEGAQILLSDQLTPSLREFVQFGTDGITKLSDAFKTEGFDGLLNTLNEVMESLIAKIISFTPQIIKVGIALLGSLINGIAKNIPTISKSLVDVALGVLSQISDAILGYNMFDSFSSFIDGLLNITTEKIPEFAKNALEWGKTFISSLGEGLDGTSIIEIYNSLLDVAVTTLKTWVPNIWQAGKELINSLIEGFGDIDITEEITKIFGAIKEIGSILLPIIQEAGQGLFNTLMKSLPIVTTFAIEMINTLKEGISEALPELIPSALNMLMEFSGALRENVGLIVDAGLELIMTLAQSLIDNLPVMLETIPTIVINIAGIINDNAPKLLFAGIELIGKLAAGIIEAVPTLIAEFPKIIHAIFAVITAVNWVSLGMNIINFIKDGVTSLAQSIPEALKDIGNNAVEWLKTIQWSTLGKDIIDLIRIGIEGLFTSIPDKLVEIGTSAIQAMAEIDWMSIGQNIIAGICNGIADVAGDLINAATGAVSDAWDALTGWLNIASPSKKARDVIGKNWALGIGLGFEQNMPENDMLAAQKEVFDELEKQQAHFNYPFTENYTIDGNNINNDDNINVSNSMIYNLLVKYLPLLANMQIVLQDRTIAGKLAPYINEELGVLAAWEAAQ